MYTRVGICAMLLLLLLPSRPRSEMLVLMRLSRSTAVSRIHRKLERSLEACSMYVHEWAEYLSNVQLKQRIEHENECARSCLPHGRLALLCRIIRGAMLGSRRSHAKAQRHPTFPSPRISPDLRLHIGRPQSRRHSIFRLSGFFAFPSHDCRRRRYAVIVEVPGMNIDHKIIALSRQKRHNAVHV